MVASVTNIYTPVLAAQAELILNSTQLYRDQVVISGYLSDRIRELETINESLRADRDSLRTRNEHLQSTNRELSAQLAQLRPSPKASPAPCLPSIPRKAT